MREKWHIKNKKRYLKIHVAVNVKTKKILSIKVTGEHVHDIKMLPELVENIKESDSVTAIGKLFADGAYDSNSVLRYTADNGILPCIKVRKNAKVKWKKGHSKESIIISQKKDLQRWKDSVSYAKRWIAKTVFSSLKRMFGEYVYSVNLKDMIQEMILRESLYNKIISS